ncbi:MAG: hypothetical protein OXU39_04260, partial [Gemmatimonadota bacterium]|nr:hypothetical protein [Gemmatimonadota bacterium]
MNSVPVLPSDTELAAAYLQLAITLGLVVLCSILNRRYRRQYFGLWSVAWAVYSLRLVAIITFLITGAEAWLFWHQVATGWTAVAFLWAALVFAQRAEWRPGYGVLGGLTGVWACGGVVGLDNCLLAAG